MPQHHLTAQRGAELAPRSVFIQGRFGRLFRQLPSFQPDDYLLEAIAASMLEPPDPDGAGEEEERLDGPIPGGYMYVGQFIDHDITFDPVSSLQRLNDPDGLHDFRTPRFHLDSVYGEGTNNNPFMYDPPSTMDAPASCSGGTATAIWTCLATCSRTWVTSRRVVPSWATPATTRTRERRQASEGGQGRVM